MENKSIELQVQITNLRGWGEIFRDLMKGLKPNLPAAADDVSKKREAYFADYKKNCGESKVALSRLSEEAAAADSPVEQNKILHSPKFQAAKEAFDRAEKSTQKTLDDFYNAVSKCPGGLIGLSRKRILSPDQVENFTREMFFYSEQMNVKNRS